MAKETNNETPAKIAEEIDLFIDYLDLERGFSEQGCGAYCSDIKRFFIYLAEQGKKPEHAGRMS